MSLRLAAPLLADFVRIARDMRPDEQAQFCAMRGLPGYDADIAARDLAATPGPAWVLVDGEGFAVLAGGFIPIRPGVYECWLAGSLAAWERHWRTFTRVCRRLMDELFANGAHRIETVALASRTAAHDWYVRGVGMVCEGLRPGYCADGQDGIGFALVRKTA